MLRQSAVGIGITVLSIVAAPVRRPRGHVDTMRLRSSRCPRDSCTSTAYNDLGREVELACFWGRYE